MKKILFFAIALAAGALAFSSCEPNDPKQPSQADFKPADLVNTMWRADSVFVDGGSGPHFFLNIFAADKAELNGDTVSYHFNGNRLICNRGEYDVTAFYGETAILKATTGQNFEIYVSKLPDWDWQSQILEPKASNFVGTWKLAYYTMNSTTYQGRWYRAGTNPGVETWELRADGSATYHSTFFKETQNGSWNFENGMQMVKNPARSHIGGEDGRITVQPLTKNWMGFVRGDGTTTYQWFFVRVK